jgi:hypothetical protein
MPHAAFNYSKLLCAQPMNDCILCSSWIFWVLKLASMLPGGKSWLLLLLLLALLLLALAVSWPLLMRLVFMMPIADSCCDWWLIPWPIGDLWLIGENIGAGELWNCPLFFSALPPSAQGSISDAAPAISKASGQSCPTTALSIDKGASCPV